MPHQITEGIANMDIRSTNGQNSPNNGIRRSSTSVSAFPKLIHAPPNVPPSDEDFEATLESARAAVLSSNDADMQLAWAQDALQQAAINKDDRDRLQSMHLARPRTPAQEDQMTMDAMNIVKFLADQHHPKAEFLRGTWFEFGRHGCLCDKKEAFRCYSRSADRSYSRAEYRVGMLYEASNDPIKALKHYHRGADAGDSACLYRLGMMTLRGQHGQEQDYAKGLDLIRRSAACADENAAQGAYVYGMLLAGELPQVQLPDGFLDPDEKAARVEIEKAAYMKFAKAQLKMGSAYELGSLGCDFNPMYSLHYFTLAARQGEAEAELGVSKWFLVGHEGLFPKNEELAYTYAQRAALSGFANAEFAMGYFNELGIHVPQDLDAAIKWYEKAARDGNNDAKGRISGISQKKILSRKDHENVALGRIRSQYGSKRGARPARFQQHTRVASEGNGPVGHRRGPSADAVPPRTSSTTPYPLSDDPPLVSPIGPVDLLDRPATTAPYPTATSPTHRTPSGIYGGGAPPLSPYADNRPSNALNMNPASRPASAAPPSANSPRPRYPSGPAPGMRPPMNGDPARRAPLNLRHVSSPVGIHGQPSGPPPPMPTHTPTLLAQSSRTPSPGIVHAQTLPAQTLPPPTQAVDIGFVAPLEPRKTRPQLSTEKPLPNSYAGNLPPNSTTPVPVQLADRPYPARQSSRIDLGSKKSTPDMRSPALTTPGTPGPLSAPSQPPTPLPGPTQTKPPTRPPGSGPKTFEEMGVPVTKQDTECVSNL